VRRSERGDFHKCSPRDCGGGGDLPLPSPVFLFPLFLFSSSCRRECPGSLKGECGSERGHFAVSLPFPPFFSFFFSLFLVFSPFYLSCSPAAGGEGREAIAFLRGRLTEKPRGGKSVPLLSSPFFPLFSLSLSSRSVVARRRYCISDYKCGTRTLKLLELEKAALPFSFPLLFFFFPLFLLLLRF